MSLQAKFSSEIPVETARVAKAIYPKGNLFMKIRDELGEMFKDESFSDLYPQVGQHSLSPSLLVLVLVMQYIADYSDRQAAEAVRDQISWKYALGLPLESQGFNYSVLSEFRQRLVEANAQDRLFKPLLEKLQEKGLLKGQKKQRTDATHVLARVRRLNRLELAGEAMRSALNRLAQACPTWLKAKVPSLWFERYAELFNTWHLPKTEAARQKLLEEIGSDGYALLSLVYRDRASLPFEKLAEIESLRQIWIQQFWLDENDAVQIRPLDSMPKGAQLIASPFDLEARFSQERGGKAWVGYKVHLSETCAEDAPRLITDVQTVNATENDSQTYPKIQKALAQKGLQAFEHYFDMGYSSVKNLVESAQAGISMFSPMHLENSWQAQANKGFSYKSFFIDWQAKQVRCPNGQVSSTWSETKNEAQMPVIHIRFARKTCQSCPLKPDCAKGQARSLKLYPQAWHEALEQARKAEKTESFKEKYRIRAGIEGTISMAVRACDLRHSPFIGLQKTSLHALLVASALNIIRALNWLNDLPLATTRKSTLAKMVA
jgi:transposase